MTDWTSEEERLVSARYTPDDLEIDRSLRPKRLPEYLGQQKVKESLGVLIEAARGRNEPLDHVLLSGPPGLGKTTLAGVIANELGVTMKTTSGPAIERPGDLAAILTNLEERDVLFIDEIHRLNHMVEEVLYPAMEDFNIDVVIGKGPAARSLRLEVPRFTLVGATTRTGLLTGPLRDRFGIAFRLDYYAPEDLEAIEKKMEEERNLFYFTIRAKADDRFIGKAVIEWVDWTNGNGWIQLGIGSKEDRCKGYGSQTMRLLLRYAFAELNLYRVSAMVPEYNEIATRLFRKLGFVEEVRRREAMERDGRRWDLLTFGQLRSEWESLAQGKQG